MPKVKKEKPKGEYRNLELMEDSENLFQFEVKLKSGEWKRFTNLAAGSLENAKIFAQRTADTWRNRP